MRILAPLLVALGATFAVSSAQADVLVIDDFSKPVPGVKIKDSDIASTGVSTTQSDPAFWTYASSRTLTHTLLLGAGATAADYAANSDGSLSVAGTGALPNYVANRLNASNAADVDSTVTVEWTLKSIDAFGLSAMLSLDVMAFDAGAAINVTLGGVDLGTRNAVAVGTPLTWALNASQASSLLTAGKVLKLTIDGNANWDFSGDNLTLTVPEPATLALVGLALLGAGVVSRRRKG